MRTRAMVWLAGVASVVATFACAEDTSKVDGASFAKQAAVIGEAEIELGRLALTNSNDADVKQFASRMVRDHEAAAAKLKAAAAQDHVMLPKSLDPKHAELKQKLEGLKGDAFDDEYMSAMAKGHDEAVALFESASQSTAVPVDLRQFAANTLPTLKEHREMAHDLHQEEGD